MKKTKYGIRNSDFFRNFAAAIYIIDKNNDKQDSKYW